MAITSIFREKLTTVRGGTDPGKLTTGEVEDFLEGRASLPVHVQPGIYGTVPTRVVLLDANGRELGHFPVTMVNVQSDYGGKTRLTVEVDITPF